MSLDSNHITEPKAKESNELFQILLPLLTLMLRVPRWMNTAGSGWVSVGLGVSSPKSRAYYEATDASASVTEQHRSLFQRHRH